MSSDVLRVELARVARELGDGDIDFVLERPRDDTHGDLATNLALVLAKRRRSNPARHGRGGAARAAGTREPHREDRDRRPRVHQLLAGAVTRSPACHARILAEGSRYGQQHRWARGSRSTSSSSRPTRPARCTWGTAGARRWATRSPSLLEWSGHSVTREFYINDAGVQIDRLAQSLWARVQQAVGREAAIPDGGYHGAVPAGERGHCVLEREGRRLRRPAVRGGDQAQPRARARDPAGGAGPRPRRLRRALRRDDVGAGGVSTGARCRTRSTCCTTGTSPYEKDGALWLRTSEFGDDIDRVLRKQDGSYTYFVPDIAYHIDKLERGFDARHRRLGRRPSRLHPADAGGAAGARLRGRVVRRGRWCSW